jgi:hypothetical protein
MTMILDGTNGEVFPSWTTGTRPASPQAGQVGWNTTIASLENYNGSAWTAVGGGGAGSLQSVQTTGFTAASGNAYPCNTTSAAFTVTLPASPSAGNFITLFDYARTFGTNNLTIAPNGNKISGSTSNAILNTSGASVSIIYVDSTQGWLAYCSSPTSIVGNYTINYLVVAGGGGGGGTPLNSLVPAGGGAGGLLTNTTTLTPGTAYTITVGAGGAAGTNVSGSTAQGQNGSASSISSLVATVGGGGGGGSYVSPYSGNSGGSGGGGSGWSSSSAAGGSGTAGQGNNGGAGFGTTTSGGGGGGGAGAVGGAATGGVSVGANGGIGVASSISGASVYYAGGGGGGGYSGAAGGTGGSGGGGNGGAAGVGVAASANTGGGGGGGGGSGGAGYAGGNGGSGVVIISYPGTQRGTGGTITSSGGNTIHTFASSGTYTA